MKRLLIISIGLILCSPTPIRAQNDGVIAAAAGALALGAAIASVENYKEQLELSATEWFLKELKGAKSNYFGEDLIELNQI